MRAGEGIKCTLSDDVGLHISVVVLASPHEASGRLECLSDHVVNQTMLVPRSSLLKLTLVLPVR